MNLRKVTQRIAKEVEELVIQGIGNQERRSILRIIAAASEGVIYSEILHELDMNTGKLNYHLKLLEGLIERDESRRYHLSPLGLKAVSTLNGLTKNLDDVDLEMLVETKTSQDAFITDAVNLWSRLFILGSISAFMGVVAFIHFNVSAGYSSQSTYLWLLLPAGVLVALYSWAEKVRKETPEKILRFLHRFNLVK